MAMKFPKRIIFTLGSLVTLSLFSCIQRPITSTDSVVSSDKSMDSSVISSEEGNKEDENVSSSISSESSFSREEQETLEYKHVQNSSWPVGSKNYRITPNIVKDNEFTVYNVKFDTNQYLAKPTTLNIKKSDYCLTYETVALYYMAFRTTPPNYTRDKNDLTKGSSYRLISTYTNGSYKGNNSYTPSLGEFNNSTGTYLELDIALSSSYGKGSRGTGRVVVVTEGIKDYGKEPVCYFTKDHYSHFSEFYNYATGWGPLFLGAGQKTSLRQIPDTVSPAF